ncbi:MAG TPA: endolytic transglycosylase MltG [Thermoleophilia bacterium]|nr:endolytic transglycosylase MltG [Thermoleophilia bacterium]
MTRGPDDAAGGPRPATGERPPGRGWTRYEPRAPSVADDDSGMPRGRGTRREDGPRRHRGRLIGYLLVAVFALVIGAGVGYARAYFSDGEVGGAVTVVVEEGSSLRAIATELERQGVVKHARAFEIRAEADGYATRFMPGTYSFRVNEPYDVLVATLLRGTKPATVKVAIPEGTTLRQAAEIVSGEISAVSEREYIEAARDDPPPFALEGYKKGSTLEGMLFPATYEVLPREVSAESFVKTQLEAFDANFAEVDMERARAADLTEYDVVIIASMIDREAMVGAERAVVAAVIWNRLRKDMLLQIDATIQYALGETKPLLTFDDLEIESPFNTYKYAGLPPTPISNPGLAALKAAANPTDDEYLYYVARNDGTGRHYFSTTYEQFLADQAKAAANGQ